MSLREQPVGAAGRRYSTTSVLSFEEMYRSRRTQFAAYYRCSDQDVLRNPHIALLSARSAWHMAPPTQWSTPSGPFYARRWSPSTHLASLHQVERARQSSEPPSSSPLLLLLKPRVVAHPPSAPDGPGDCASRVELRLREDHHRATGRADAPCAPGNVDVGFDGIGLG